MLILQTWKRRPGRLSNLFKVMWLVSGRDGLDLGGDRPEATPAAAALARRWHRGASVLQPPRAHVCHKERKTDFNLSLRRKLLDNTFFVHIDLPHRFVLFRPLPPCRGSRGDVRTALSSDLMADPLGGCGLLVCGWWPLEPGASRQAALFVLDASRAVVWVPGNSPRLSDSNLSLFCHVPVRPALTCHCRGLVGSGSWLLDGEELRAET